MKRGESHEEKKRAKRGESHEEKKQAERAARPLELFHRIPACFKSLFKHRIEQSERREKRSERRERCPENGPLLTPLAGGEEKAPRRLKAREDEDRDEEDDQEGG